LEYRPAAPFEDLAQTPSVIRLHGSIPAGARSFSFNYGLALGTYALNIRTGEGAVRTQWIVGAQSSEPVPLEAPAPPPGPLAVALQYFGLGFTHILPNGFDHVLFVVGIFLLTTRWRWILAQVSTFTIAHSITLALTMYGLVSLPAKIVEPMIALSIACVAIENVLVSDVKPWRLAGTVAASGGSRVQFGGWRVSLTSPLRPLVAAAVVVGVRHLLVRESPIHSHLVARVDAWRRSAALRVAATASLGTRLPIFFVGFMAVVLFGYARAG